MPRMSAAAGSRIQIARILIDRGDLYLILVVYFAVCRRSAMRLRFDRRRSAAAPPCT